VQLLAEFIECVETALYLGVTLARQLTWSAHVKQMRKKVAQRLGALGPLLNRRSGLSDRNGVLLYKQLTTLTMHYVCSNWRFSATAISGRCKFYNPRVLKLRLTQLGKLVRGKFTRI
jgi:hypothetical protein